MKLVAVSQRVVRQENTSETRDALDQNLVRLLAASGYLAVPTPNALLENDQEATLLTWLTEIAPKAILLSGGNDLGESLDRDSSESLILNFALQKTLPLLGICRGMQMLANNFGASIHRVEGHVRTRHRLKGEISLEVNSFHNYSISNCPNCFRVVSHSIPDGEIEAIKHKTLGWEGWMWHPEREKNFREEEISRIRTIFG